MEPTADRAGPSGLRAVLAPAVVVAALGYFVDIYDLILFNMFVWARPALGLHGAALAVGVFWFALALVSATQLRETFGTDLDFVEPE